MSGGVDSSVTAALLHKAGHKVVGFTFRLWDEEYEQLTGLNGKADAAINDAKKVSDHIGIRHEVLDLSEVFRQEVLERFERDYLAGVTPNPCVHCNPNIKFKSLWNAAQAHGLKNISTGHYALVEHDPDGTPHLRRAVYLPKDQSYFLWQIPREILKRVIFPLASYTKPEVRKIAEEFGLPVAQKSESQEVCFVPNDDYRAWLLARSPKLVSGELSGEIYDRDGKKLSTHPGYPFFTIGQRKGLGLGGGRKYYVTSIDSETKRIYLGDREDLYSDTFRVGSVNKIRNLDFDGTQSFEVKIRYRDPGVQARVTINDDQTLTIKTDEPVSAVTPGQSAVIYLNDEVIAGGLILRGDSNIPNSE